MGSSCTALVLVFSPIDPSISGLALIYVLQMANMFQWLVRLSIETENQFTSVERLTHYKRNLPTEGDGFVPGLILLLLLLLSARDRVLCVFCAPFIGEFDIDELIVLLSETSPQKDWPSNGVVEFDLVSVSYGPSLSPVLRDLSFKSYPAEKIGIVGRTGAVFFPWTTFSSLDQLFLRANRPW